jgi:hypothetical protein
MIRKLCYAMMLSLSVIFAVIVMPGTASAAPFARAEWQGYFNGGSQQWGVDLFPGGAQVNNVVDLVALYRTNLNSNNPQLAVGAGFTILTMLGYSAGTPLAKAINDPSVFATWQSTVEYYDSQGWIHYQESFPYNYNTYYYAENGTWGDVAWYANQDQRDSIVFYNPDGVTHYAIKRDCANPVGDMTPLVKKPPTTISLQCGNMLPIAKVESGDKVTVTVTVTYTQGPPQSTPTGQISVSGIGNVPLKLPIGSTGGPTGTFTMVSQPFTVSSIGKYAVSWNMQADGQPSPSCGGDINVPGDTFDVFNYPYFNVMGGDVAAGSRFATDVTGPGSSCGDSDSAAGIVGWNKNTAPFNGTSASAIRIR